MRVAFYSTKFIIAPLHRIALILLALVPSSGSDLSVNKRAPRGREIREENLTIPFDRGNARYVTNFHWD